MTETNRLDEELNRLWGTDDDRPKISTPGDYHTERLDDQRDGWATKAHQAARPGDVVLVSATESGYCGWLVRSRHLPYLLASLEVTPDDWSEEPIRDPLAWEVLDRWADMVSPI